MTLWHLLLDRCLTILKKWCNECKLLLYWLFNLFSSLSFYFLDLDAVIVELNVYFLALNRYTMHTVSYCLLRLFLIFIFLFAVILLIAVLRLDHVCLLQFLFLYWLFFLVICYFFEDNLLLLLLFSNLPHCFFKWLKFTRSVVFNYARRSDNCSWRWWLIQKLREPRYQLLKDCSSLLLTTLSFLRRLTWTTTWLTCVWCGESGSSLVEEIRETSILVFNVILEVVIIIIVVCGRPSNLLPRYGRGWCEFFGK